MKVYVMVDIEGISGIYHVDQTIKGRDRFDEGRRFLTADVNACVAGLKEAGVDEIHVCDCHDSSYSLIWDEASADVDYYISGYIPTGRYHTIDECDAVILLGYHAMSGTQGAVLRHSYSGGEIQNMYMNGTRIGEIAYDAAIAGEHNKPVIMVSGDDKAVAEAKEFLPNVVTACVKKGMSFGGAMLMPAEKAHKLIYEKTIEAVKNFENCKPFTFKKPLECKLEVTTRITLNNMACDDYMKIIDGQTLLVTGDTAEEILNRAFRNLR